MSDREKAIQLLNIIPDYKMSYIIAYLQGAAIAENEEPNEETIAAIQEIEDGGGTVFKGSAHDFVSAMLRD